MPFCLSLFLFLFSFSSGIETPSFSLSHTPTIVIFITKTKLLFFRTHVRSIFRWSSVPWGIYRQDYLTVTDCQGQQWTSMFYHTPARATRKVLPYGKCDSSTASCIKAACRRWTWLIEKLEGSVPQYGTSFVIGLLSVVRYCYLAALM